MTCFQRACLQLVIGVCPQTNENMRVVKIEFYRKIVRRFALESCLTVHVGGCPMDYFGELSNNLPRRVVHKVNKLICLETIFIHGTSMCERVGEDSRHGIGHIDIRVGIMNSLECVYLPLHEHLGGE